MSGMSIGKAKSELQAAMSGSTGRQWCYTQAVTAVLAVLEEAEQRIAELKSQVIAQAPVLPEGVPIELRDEIIDLCNGYEIGDVGAQEIWEACRAAALNQTYVKQPASNGQSFGNSEQLNSPAVPDGWALVPVNATRAMIDAAARVEEDGYDAMHKAMLAAAPKRESE